jgi:hypothetical protein
MKKSRQNQGGLVLEANPLWSLPSGIQTLVTRLVEDLPNVPISSALATNNLTASFRARRAASGVSPHLATSSGMA